MTIELLDGQIYAKTLCYEEIKNSIKPKKVICIQHIELEKQCHLGFRGVEQATMAF